MVKENSVEKESRSFLVLQREKNGKPHKLDQGTSLNLASLGIIIMDHNYS